MTQHHADIFQRKTKRRLWPFVLFLILFFGVLAGFGYYKIINTDIADIFESNFIQKQMQHYVPEEYKSTLDMLPALLGFESPKTYLIVFQNDTELRTGGGFIGSYATIRVTRGNVEVLALEGTETLDKNTPESWRPEPPAIMKKELGVDRWYFRDSNWDPLFYPNAARALQFYRAEGGVAGEELDGLITIDTQVLETFMGLSGPMTVQGITFTKENVTETLEYEVEYGFAKRGIPFEERKQIMKPLFHALLKKIGVHVVTEPEAYIVTMESLAKEKHIAVYLTDPVAQLEMEKIGFSGKEGDVTGDFLLWTDANLAALKTDHAMKRELRYDIRTGEGGPVHVAEMIYTHTGTFDWRTSRYRTYARIFVPEGGELKEVVVTEKNGSVQTISPERAVIEPYGERVSFGYFFVVEPGDERRLAFIYTIPPHIGQASPYQLHVLKQFGTDAHSLTLSLDFGKNITAADPPEEQQEWGDAAYRAETDLRVDRAFRVDF
ncbi:MAG: hypothetical protein COU33_01520 [Candidatus Magasanikbacteria bacterium CG10_big_fil_rev_8_21_14_0_10_43_6]|uniref:DUF4012 domain-containing protein n=1 Tax=Candidatus Magasanikbacteria bacterium CG10_big_fil_rev_8_21_14_0_10_43_6 TaxID=1974650 RepID=A0A2M6W1S8_9BACT|nr:MAG: hypothetical protein COU33_01520 [Candidatus Magasanikbacteria bacterium CG10_big_fil_rev_8_21_14_0_10_43_6]